MSVPQQPIDIGIWGPRAAGKTTYLAGVYLAINRDYPHWRMRPKDGNDEAAKFLEECAAGIAEGKFPHPTPPGPAVVRSFRFWCEPSLLGLTGGLYETTLFDAAGEAIVNPNDPYGLYANLRHSTGILCMVDPDIREGNGQPGPRSHSQSYAELIFRLLNQLAQDQGLTPDGKLLTSIAFCLTKMDMDAHWNYREHPEGYFAEIVGKPAYDAIINYCDRRRVHFFATSVAGRYLTPQGEWRPNIQEVKPGEFRIIDLKQWRPYKPLEPLLWLFDRVEQQRTEALPFVKREVRRILRRPYHKD